MPFQPGQSGNPGGRGTEKIWRDALLRAVKRREPFETEKGKPPQRLDLLAEQAVKQGLAGDVSALREIGDRLDGKAVQQIQAEIEATTTNEIRMVPVPPEAPDA